jgi:hypothetical protein
MVGIPSSGIIGIRIAINKLTVAVLLANSEKMVVITHNAKIITHSSKTLSPAQLFAIHKLKPETSTPFAKANPPPNKNKIPSGRRFTSSQLINVSPFLFFDGKEK